MRLLTILTSACGALALATGPVHRPTDQQAVDSSAPLSLEHAALEVHDFTRRDEKALSVGKRNTILNGLKLPTTASPASVALMGVKIIYNMAGHFVKEGSRYLYHYYVESMQVINELEERMVVEITAAGQTVIDAHLSQSQSATGTVPAGAQTFALVLRELNNEL
ncbi:hypothetical protein E4U32_000215 [Claviceps aff. humidiphila group G2b]|nr:hypothetical protein E4U32_000215 [Claviceps aff. humidiphila group G2b]